MRRLTYKRQLIRIPVRCGSLPSTDVFRAIAIRRGARCSTPAAPETSPSSDLAGPFRMTQPAVSQHLRILRDAGLVRAEQMGRQRVLPAQSAAATRGVRVGEPIPQSVQRSGGPRVARSQVNRTSWRLYGDQGSTSGRRTRHAAFDGARRQEGDRVLHEGVRRHPAGTSRRCRTARASTRTCGIGQFVDSGHRRAAAVTQRHGARVAAPESLGRRRPSSSSTWRTWTPRINARSTPGQADPAALATRSTATIRLGDGSVGHIWAISTVKEESHPSRCTREWSPLMAKSIYGVHPGVTMVQSAIANCPRKRDLARSVDRADSEERTEERNGAARTG